MGRQVGLSAVTVIIALGIGGELLGVVGAILSVPTAAIIQVLFEELVARRNVQHRCRGLILRRLSVPAYSRSVA